MRKYIMESSIKNNLKPLSKLLIDNNIDTIDMNCNNCKEETLRKVII